MDAEIRRFRPSTVSRRFFVTAGFYRACVLDGVLERSPAEHVRSPLGPSRLAVLAAANVPSCLELIRSRIARGWMLLVSGAASADTGNHAGGQSFDDRRCALRFSGWAGRQKLI